jgi:hypothetical protein
MTNTKRNNLRKWGGIVALLAVLAISDSASAINLTIGNTTAGGSVSGTDVGQSFKNDPAGSGASITLNDWTFAFFNSPSATNALTKTLSIYSGGGNGGSLLYNSTSTSATTLAGLNSVTWTFTGATLTDNATYTAVTQVPSEGLAASDANPYPDGTAFFVGSSSFGAIDIVFQGDFTATAATPVPFEFEPTGGLLILGGGWLLCRHLKKKSTKV